MHLLLLRDQRRQRKRRPLQQQLESHGRRRRRRWRRRWRWRWRRRRRGTHVLYSRAYLTLWVQLLLAVRELALLVVRALAALHEVGAQLRLVLHRVADVGTWAPLDHGGCVKANF